METSIVSENGQITIPKEIREKLGTAKGNKLILDLKENKIIITKPQTNKISWFFFHKEERKNFIEQLSC